METLLQDLRYGTRSLLKSHRFTLAAVLTLAFGIGINAAMFSVIRSVLLAPWPVKDPSRLLVVYQRQANGASNVFSTRDFLDWKQQGGLLANMGAYLPRQFNLSSAGEQPDRIRGGQVSYETLRLLGVEPVLGRLFTPAEDVAGSGNFVILSSALWRARYHADPHLIGQAIQINGSPYNVVGIMPAGFDIFGGQQLLWAPLQLTLNGGFSSSPNIHWLQGFIRLPDGVTAKQARAQLDSIAARLHRQDPSGDVGFGVDLQSIDDVYTGQVRPALLMLMGCVAFVLLIACVNVANLLLARGSARRREIAIRSALGASRVRVVRQLLTESVLLAFTGGALGLAFAFLVLRGMLAIHPPGVPRIDAVTIDTGVLVLSLLVSILVGVLFGLAPAIDAARIDVNSSLKEREAPSAHGFGRQRSILVIAETALACVLLIGTGLALKSLWSLRTVQLGFNPAHVLTFRIAAPQTLTGQQLSNFYKQIADRVRAVPGVQSTAVARNLPLSGGDPSMPIVVQGKQPAIAQGEFVTRLRAVGDDYFRTLEIPILNGRAFNEHDSAISPAVAIVSQSLARRYWPGENPIGKQLKPNYKGSPWCTVVGVAADVRHWGADQDIEPTAYYFYPQISDSIRQLLEADMAIAVRSNANQSDLMHSIRAAVAGIDSNVPIYQVQTMDSLVSDSGSLRRFDLSLLGAFSSLALALAAIGVYAVMAYSVSQRTKEIGIRIALGAHSRNVLGLILKQGATLAVTGVILGVAASFFLRKTMDSFLYGLSANDPLILSVVPVIIVAVVLLACYVPARRASKVDPIIALRCE
ncbi:MAG TPA: ABC transporter permease [Silvibacterium sp.]|nr:ABC transporter permease [Silvibacterium sp.]